VNKERNGNNLYKKRDGKLLFEIAVSIHFEYLSENNKISKSIFITDLVIAIKANDR
jgi:hypothetical protein